MDGGRGKVRGGELEKARLRNESTALTLLGQLHWNKAIVFKRIRR